MSINDGDEIEFGKGKDGNTIELPDPRLCSLHLAVARVYAASGITELLHKIVKDSGYDDSALNFVGLRDGSYVRLGAYLNLIEE